MAEDLNSVDLIGRLTRDAELKYSNSGSAITNLSLAVNSTKKQGDQWVEEVSFFDLVVFGRRGEALTQYLIKGTQIAIDGSLKQERWKDSKTQDNRSKIIIKVKSIQLLGGNKQGYNNNSNNSYSQPPSKPSYKANGGGGDFEDDIPFMSMNSELVPV